MPPDRTPARGQARPARRPRFVVAVTDLYLGGQPGTGSLPQLAHRAGERLTSEAAEANGWADQVRPEPEKG